VGAGLGLAEGVIVGVGEAVKTAASRRLPEGIKNRIKTNAIAEMMATTAEMNLPV